MEQESPNNDCTVPIDLVHLQSRNVQPLSPALDFSSRLQNVLSEYQAGMPATATEVEVNSGLPAEKGTMKCTETEMPWKKFEPWNPATFADWHHVLCPSSNLALPPGLFLLLDKGVAKQNRHTFCQDMLWRDSAWGRGGRQSHQQPIEIMRTNRKLS